MADGTIPEDQQKVLLEMGAWLESYGEAIYGTRPWYTFGEGPTLEPDKDHPGAFQNITYSARDVRYTTSGSTVYALFLGKPEEGGEVLLESFSLEKSGQDIQVKSVSIPGESEALEWKQDDKGLTVSLSSGNLDPMSTVLKIETRE